MGEPGLERRGRSSRLRLVLRAGALALVVLLFALLVQRTLAKSAGPRLISEIKAGKKPAAPGFDLPVIWRRSETWPASLQAALTDGRISPQEVHGYAVVVNFWASWCGPCRREAPALQRLWEEYGDRGVQFLGVNFRDDAAAARAYEEEFGITYPSVSDPSGKMAYLFQVLALPTTFVIGDDGRIAYHFTGIITEPLLRRSIEDGFEAGSS
jgi:thiol-disulfide isomerase/thioredoxin